MLKLTYIEMRERKQCKQKQSESLSVCLIAMFIESKWNPSLTVCSIWYGLEM